MRRLSCLVFLLLVPCAAAGAQAPVTGSDWHRVQALPAGSKVHVAGDHESHTCNLQKVDDDSLTCKGAAGGVHTLARGDIKTVKVARYGTSTLVGTGIGAGLGFVFGASLPNGGSNAILSRGALGGIFAVIGAVPGAILGGATDFCHGTIYRRPRA